MDNTGNILGRRYSKSNIFVKAASNSMNEETAIGSEIMKSPSQNLELEKVMKVFEYFSSRLYHAKSEFIRVDFRHEKIPIQCES